MLHVTQTFLIERDIFLSEIFNNDNIYKRRRKRPPTRCTFHPLGITQGILGVAGALFWALLHSVSSFHFSHSQKFLLCTFYLTLECLLSIYFSFPQPFHFFTCTPHIYKHILVLYIFNNINIMKRKFASEWNDGMRIKLFPAFNTRWLSPKVDSNLQDFPTNLLWCKVLFFLNGSFDYNFKFVEYHLLFLTENQVRGIFNSNPLMSLSSIFRKRHKGIVCSLVFNLEYSEFSLFLSICTVYVMRNSMDFPNSWSLCYLHFIPETFTILETENTLLRRKCNDIPILFSCSSWNFANISSQTLLLSLLIF